MRLIGIDLAWRGQHNPSAIAYAELFQDGIQLIDLKHGIQSVEEIVFSISKFQPDGIAIDAPLIIPNETGQRLCERKVGEVYGSRKASCHTSNLTLYPKSDGTTLAECLEAIGYVHLGRSSGRWQIECYPHPALIEIFELFERLPYKKGSVSQRRNGQIRLANLLIGLKDSLSLPLHVREELEPFNPCYIETLRGEKLKQNEDLLDAVICVYIAGLYARGCQEVVFGSVEAGYIYIPRKA